MTENGRPSKSGDVHGVPDATLGGYFGHHDRPPAFEGSDGQPYTVSIEVEKTADLAAPYHGYLVFPRWAETGLGIVGHVETPTLFETRSRRDAVSRLEELPLDDVKRHLDDAIRTRDEDPAEEDRAGEDPAREDPAGENPAGSDRAGGSSRTAKDPDAP